MPSLSLSHPQRSHPQRPLVPSTERPLRVLHVIGNLDCGGIETWLMQVLRRLDREQIAMDFLVHSDQLGYYAAEAKALGSQILICPYSRNPQTYAKGFKHLLQSQSKDGQPAYDIIHSHIHWLSGQVLWLAQQLNIPHRIAHSHNDTRVEESSKGMARQLYRHFMSMLLQRYATQGIAVSRRAAEDLFGSRWQDDPRWKLLYCGVDFQPFMTAPVTQTPVITAPDQPSPLRAELGIPADAFVVGHVGRFAAQKNHEFLLETFRVLLERQPNAYLLLVGEGELRADIQAQIRRLELGDRVLLPGLRSDIPALMQSVMDCFCFPSRYEGLGLVAIEAQAAGLPCLLSQAVPPEAIVVPELVQSLDLSDSSDCWATVLSGFSSRTRLGFPPALTTSPINIDNNVVQLEALYRGRDI